MIEIFVRADSDEEIGKQNITQLVNTSEFLSGCGPFHYVISTNDSNDTANFIAERVGYDGPVLDVRSVDFSCLDGDYLFVGDLSQISKYFPREEMLDIPNLSYFIR